MEAVMNTGSVASQGQAWSIRSSHISQPKFKNLWDVFMQIVDFCNKHVINPVYKDFVKKNHRIIFVRK